MQDNRKARRVAISFDDEMYDYYQKMSKLRGEPFSVSVGSVLSSVMIDDKAIEGEAKRATKQ